MEVGEVILRLLEESLIAAPLALYLLWRFTLGRGQPPTRRALVLLAAGVGVLALMLAWTGTHDNQGAPHAPYAPAQLRDGTIIPGRSG